VNNDCKCKHDNPDKKHWSSTCPECGSVGLVLRKVCDDYDRCNHQWGYKCEGCSNLRWPTDGHGWCSTVREIKFAMVNVDQCINKGCTNKCTTDKYYCSHNCAKFDGCLVPELC